MVTREGRIAGIRYLPLTVESKVPENELAARAARQIERYRDDPDTKFDLPLLVEHFLEHLPAGPR